MTLRPWLGKYKRKRPLTSNRQRGRGLVHAFDRLGLAGPMRAPLDLDQVGGGRARFRRQEVADEPASPIRPGSVVSGIAKGYFAYLHRALDVLELTREGKRAGSTGEFPGARVPAARRTDRLAQITSNRRIYGAIRRRNSDALFPFIGAGLR